jgi:hypothetical protein
MGMGQKKLPPKNAEASPHPAQVALWTMSTVGILAAGAWTVFVYVRPPILSRGDGSPVQVLADPSSGPSSSGTLASGPDHAPESSRYLDRLVIGGERLALVAVGMVRTI